MFVRVRDSRPGERARHRPSPLPGLLAASCTQVTPRPRERGHRPPETGFLLARPGHRQQLADSSRLPPHSHEGADRRAVAVPDDAPELGGSGVLASIPARRSASELTHIVCGRSPRAPRAGPRPQRRAPSRRRHPSARGSGRSPALDPLQLGMGVRVGATRPIDLVHRARADEWDLPELDAAPKRMRVAVAEAGHEAATGEVELGCASRRVVERFSSSATITPSSIATALATGRPRPR